MQMMRESLRLRHEKGLSQRDVASSLGIGHTVALSAACPAGSIIDWIALSPCFLSAPTRREASSTRSAPTISVSQPPTRREHSLANWNKATFDKVAGYLASEFDISKDWFYDLNSYDAA